MRPWQRSVLAAGLVAAAVNTFLPWTYFGLFSLSLWDYAGHATAFQYEAFGRLNPASPFGMLYLFYLLPPLCIAGAILAWIRGNGAWVRILTHAPLFFALSFIGAYVGVNKAPFFLHTIDYGMIAGVALGVVCSVVGSLRLGGRR